MGGTSFSGAQFSVSRPVFVCWLSVCQQGCAVMCPCLCW
jgi:hypothetical protein